MSSPTARPDSAQPAPSADWRAVASFVALTFAFSWAVWLVGYRVVGDGPATTLALFVGAFGPAVGAVARLRLEGRSVRSWARRRLRFRVPARWYLVAVAVPLVIAAVHTVAFVARGVPLDPSALVARLPLIAVGIVVTALVGGGQEEFGWRGYLLPRLQSAVGPLAASLVVGVVWALWHLPLFVLPGAYNWGSPFALYVPVVVCLAVVFTWLCNRVGGALPVLILLHAVVNNAATVTPVPRTAFAGVTPTVEYATQAVGALLVVLVVLAVDGVDLGRDAGADDPARPETDAESATAPGSESPGTTQA
ncbi:type II CAAX prenyl endopeptidase Rce1 family protein [Halobium salinum]|uniref:Type II CAAX prenyl endopeptidase Rce1 family protein n=1 Tax=Halobium salinum TaxID=1364940 RepID=A0ABD5PB93_9EURY|nr:type II CAAX endopeptidase family protein [Halobium salinum]